MELTDKHYYIYKIDNQQGLTVEHRELKSVFYKKALRLLDLKKYICITKSLCCITESDTIINQL